MNVSEIKVGEEYCYRGFYEGKTHFENVTIKKIERKKRQIGYVHMSNGKMTLVEQNGEVRGLSKILKNNPLNGKNNR